MSAEQQVPFIVFLAAPLFVVVILLSVLSWRVSVKTAAMMVAVSVMVAFYTYITWVFFPLTKCTWPESPDGAFEYLLSCDTAVLNWVPLGVFWLVVLVWFASLIWKGRASGTDED